MESLALERFAGFWTEAQLSDIPQPVIEKTKLCLLDVLECCARAPKDHRWQGALGSMAVGRVLNGAAVWGEGFCLNAPDAAFVNAVRGSLSYRNDLHRKSACHAGAIVCAAALAVAEQYGASTERALLGMLTGYESMLRLGEILAQAGLPKGWRSSAVCAPFGAAMAAAKTLGLSARQTVSAASFACHSAAGNNEWAEAGTGEDVFHAGWGARNGVSAALLASAGAVGCASGLEGENGLLACFGAGRNAAGLIEGLGAQYKVLEVEYKPMEACLMLQAPCQAARQIRQLAGFDAGRITSVQIAVAGQAKCQPGCDARIVGNAVQAKMSLRYGVAKELTGIAGWQATIAELQKVMDCTQVVEEAAFTRQFPLRTPARVTVVTAAGTYQKEVSDFMPLTPKQVEERFLAACSGWLGSRNAEAVRAEAARLEQPNDVRQLAALLKH